MGGTLIRLVEQGHAVHVAYMTSGNIAVFDHDAWRFTDFVVEFNRCSRSTANTRSGRRTRVQDFLRPKKPGQPDSEELLKIKALIRADGGRGGGAGVRHPAGATGLHGPALLSHRHHRQGPIHPQDIEDIVALLERLQPAQIYVAGEMSDPHGTHRICAEAIFQAVRRGAGSRGSTSRSGSIAVPGRSGSRTRSSAWCRSSPDDLERKKLAIFRHQSQKDRAMFPGGSDRREFWQRAEDRNRHTAKVYDALGCRSSMPWKVSCSGGGLTGRHRQGRPPAPNRRPDGFGGVKLP